MNGFSPADYEQYTHIIHANVITAIRQLVTASRRFHIVHEKSIEQMILQIDEYCHVSRCVQMYAQQVDKCVQDVKFSMYSFDESAPETTVTTGISKVVAIRPTSTTDVGVEDNKPVCACTCTYTQCACAWAGVLGVARIARHWQAIVAHMDVQHDTIGVCSSTRIYTQRECRVLFEQGYMRSHTCMCYMCCSR
jgi:hypothetical protein